MSLVSFMTDIKTVFFGSNKQNILAKISPKLNDCIPEPEVKDGDFYRRLLARQAALELSSKSHIYDLEVGDKSIIYEEVAIYINEYERCKIIENYVSFMDVINYFATPFDDCDLYYQIYELPYVVNADGEYSLKMEYPESSVNPAINMSDDRGDIDLPLHLPLHL